MNSNQMKVLFLTRVHPPIVGGLENQSYNLIKSFKQIHKKTFSIINTKGKRALPWFLPYCFVKSMWLIRKQKITCIHLSDGVLVPIGICLKKLTGVKVVVTIHGLDISFKNKQYQKIIPKAINRLDKIICVSDNTRKECLKREIPEKNIVVVPNGVNIEEFVMNGNKNELRKKLSKKLKIDFGSRKLLITTGRLVKRKGVKWFVDNVMPKLNRDYIYLIAGDGLMEDDIKRAIHRHGLDHVYLLGKANKEIMKLLYNSADLFVMPNISVHGDIEGFGLVALEAGSCGLPVVASRVDGIPNAIIEGKTGWLVKEKDVDGFIEKIKSGELDSETVKKEVQRNFDWKNVAKRYKKVFFGIEQEP